MTMGESDSASLLNGLHVFALAVVSFGNFLISDNRTPEISMFLSECFAAVTLIL